MNRPRPLNNPPTALNLTTSAINTSDKDSSGSPTSSSPTSPHYRKGKHSVYVLSADGSSLFLLDPSKPLPHEQPPPYQFDSRGQRTTTAEETDTPSNSLGLTTGFATNMASSSSSGGGLSLGPRTASETGTRRQRASTVTAAVIRRTRASSDASDRGRRGGNPSAAIPPRPIQQMERIGSDYGPRRHTRSDASEGLRGLADERTPLLAVPNTSTPSRSPGGRSIRSVSISSVNPLGSTSLPNTPHRSTSWRNMLRANSVVESPMRVQTVNTAQGEAVVVTRARKKKHWAIRYARPLWSAAHWKALFHLVFLNFPLTLLVWPFLVAGTLTGTALLVVLPIGALVWLLTLLLSRSVCRLEIAMQSYFHAPLSSQIPRPTYHPIFQRIKTVVSPHGSIRAVVDLHENGNGNPNAPMGENAEVVWEKNVFKNAWAMFCDHLSYQGLTYLVLTKAIVTLLSTIVIVIIVPVSAALIFPLPGVLEIIRRFGRWQAGLAIEALQ